GEEDERLERVPWAEQDEHAERGGDDAGDEHEDPRVLGLGEPLRRHRVLASLVGCQQSGTAVLGNLIPSLAMSAVEPPRHAVVEAVQRALAEDLTPLGDLTSSLLPADAEARATFVPRVDGVLAGRACAVETFRQVDPTVELEWSAVDGDALRAGQP